jgi:transcriptional regulator with XRE-family HTH domain
MLDFQVKDAIRDVPYAIRMETIGDRIRQCRNARGMTQLELAEAVGVTKGAVSQWELGGTKNVKLSTFLRLVEVLHTTAEYLVSGQTPAATGRYRAVRKPES